MKKILAISLSLILLISHVGLTIATHYCGGMAVKSELMLGHNHLDCGMPDMDSKSEHNHKTGLHLKAKPCCENEYRTMQVEEIYTSNLVQHIVAPEFVIAFVHAFLDFSLFPETEKPQHANYSPPILLRDVPVLNQVFLI